MDGQKENAFKPIALQSRWHPSQWSLWSSNNYHTFSDMLKNQTSPQNEQAAEAAYNQHHFHNNWPETVQGKDIAMSTTKNSNNIATNNTETSTSF